MESDTPATPPDHSPSSSPLPSPPPPPPPPPPLPLPPPPDLSSLLSRFPPHPPPSLPAPIRKQTSEQTDEKCWIFTNQSNARRALGLEPQISMYCYLNFRNSLSSLVPVPGHPNAFLAKDAPPPPTIPQEGEDGPGNVKKIVLKSSRIGDVEKVLPNYWWKWLDGRYFYVAKGKTQVERHFKEMGNVEEGGEGEVNSWKMISKIEKRIKEQQELNDTPEKKQERQIKRALKVVDLNENSESLTSISSLYSTTLQRFHSHLLRIYSPLITSLTILPKTFQDGTQSELLSTVFGRLTDGSAFVLGERMVNSLGKVGQELKERREKRDQERRGSVSGGSGSVPPVDVGLGGQQPRLPPPRSNNSIFGTSPSKRPDQPEQGEGTKEGIENQRPKPPPYSPGCNIM
ncbi:hypothetical protein JCM5350_000370 [Sporobolomyces pararoseus]